MKNLSAVLLRDIRLDIRRGGQVIFLPAFFLLIVMLFPLGLGPASDDLSRAAPGLLMVAALLASILPLEKLYAGDLSDGTADLVKLSGHPLAYYIAGKATAHWLIAGLPLVVTAPVLAQMLDLNAGFLPVIFTFIPVTALFVLIGQIASLLSVSAQRGSVLLALLAVPLYIPVLVFGAGALDLAQNQMLADAPILFLWAMLSLALPVVPLVGAKLLEMQMDG